MFVSEIVSEGRVLSQIGEDVYRVELRNGHQAVGHLAKELKKNKIKILSNQRILLSFSTHDLTRACIVQAIPDL
jgi:translation initiation factor IF-1